MQQSNRWVRVLHRDMDESKEHHSQQTDTRIENEIPHVLTYRRVMNNENTWTQVGERQWGWGGGGDRGRVGRDNMGRNARYSMHLK